MTTETRAGDSRLGNHGRAALVEGSCILLIIALTSGLAEVGAQFRSAFHPRGGGAGFPIYEDKFVEMLVEGKGVMFVNDALGERRWIPHWWGFLVVAFAGAVLVKSPLLLAPVWLIGRTAARFTKRWWLATAYIIGLVAGAVTGVVFFLAFLSVRFQMLPTTRLLVHAPHFAGLASCIAGGACGALIVVGCNRRRTISARLLEIALIAIVINAVAWLVMID
jgi:hypothetical protein